MRERIKKFGIVRLVIMIMVIISITIAVTYAYFAAVLDSGSSTQVNVSSSTVDRLNFGGTPDAIVLYMSQNTFTQTAANSNSGHATQEGNVTATLKAQSAGSSKTYTYYVYLYIKENSFVYSYASAVDLLFTIKDPAGTAITSINNLTYANTNSHIYLPTSGFDITTKTGLYKIATQTIGPINANTTSTQTWNYTFSIVNIPFDQSINIGKSMTAYVIITPNELTASQAQSLVG